MNEGTPAQLASDDARETVEAGTGGADMLSQLADEFARRWRAGERPSVDEYARRYPALAREILDAFPAIAAMEQPGLAGTADLFPSAERVGSTIGRYKLLERIGEGGFGVVFMAEQVHPVRRKVAMKVIKPGFDTRQVIARFEAERQALALMDHENIARVLDAGATDFGRPYFVMELVHGVPITEYCDKNQLPPRERLELFVQVCRAVQHAHTKGIIHRDIKPTNVLVTMHEGVPVPKVIDFGIAKATGQQLTDKTLFTNFAQMVGTPLYMSPEQAEMTGLDVDTRSDVYSLGVLLYELLTGTTPVNKDRLKQAAFDEVRRIIREEEPPRPSTRLSTMGEPARRSVSAQRRSDPKQLGRVVRGELDWIVMKALEKERSRRYETASGLARDVEHYLRDEPVLACPPSASYRLRKVVRRYRVPVAVGAAFVLLLVAASVVSTWQAVRATRAEREVSRQRDQVRTALVKNEQSERTARQRLGTQLIAVGDAALASGKSAARDSYWEAWELARAMGGSELPAATGLLASYSEQPPPLMGNDGGRRGVGGFEGHTRSPNLAFLADGRRAVSVGYDGAFILWDVVRGTALRTLPGVGQHTQEVALSPDERRLLTADEDGALRLWDVASGEMLRKIGPGASGGRSVRFSADGTRAISACDDHTVRIWDLDTGAELRRMKAPDHVNSVAFLPGGRRAISCGQPDLTIVWDLETGKAIHTMSDGGGSTMIGLDVSPDGRTAISGGMSNRVTVWDLESGRALRAFANHTGVVRSVAFSPDGRLALSGGSDRTVRLWDVASARQVGIWYGHVGHVMSVRFSPDGRLALSGDGNGGINLWDLREQQEAVDFRGHADRVISLSANPDGRTVLSGSFDRTAKLWDVATGMPIVTLAAGGTPIWGVALAPDGSRALTAQEDGTVALWDVPAASRVRTLGKHDDVATGVAISPDGRTALSCSSDTTLKLWDLQTGEAVRTFNGHTFKVRAVTFAPDGRTALSAAFDQSLKLWDVDTGQVLRTLRGHNHWVHSVAFSSDGRRAASGGWDYRWGLWDLTSGTNLRLRQWDPAVVTGVAFSPDGTLLATGSVEGSLGLWDLVNDVHVRDLQRRPYGPPSPTTAPGTTTRPSSPHDYGVTSLAFCADGVTVLAGSREGIVRRWQLDRPARYNQFAKALPGARAALAANPNDGEALAVFGRWYGFRGVDDWAAELLEKARDRGADVTSLELARCYWRLGRREDAAREFDEAIRRNEAPRPYLEMCRTAAAAKPDVTATAARTTAR